jgi:glycosyltransferase involved in cell wall biosynthesis
MKFILNTITSWDEAPRARHQVAYSLSELHQVMFISANKIGTPKLKEILINKNLTIIMPYFPIDFRFRYRIPVLNEIYQRWLYSKLRKKFGDIHVLNFDYTATQVFRFFSHVVFYCNDDFYGISKRYNPFPISNYLIRCIDYLIKKADFCIGISEIMVEKLKKINPESYLIKLGGPNPSKIQIIPNTQPGNDRNRINCGLVGFLTPRNTSVEILNSLLSVPNIFLTLVGPVHEEVISALINKEKVILKGILTGDLLYDEINKFDVAIAPYNVKRMNEGGTPNKLWQYLIMGKPVVMTELAATKNWIFSEGLVYVSKSDSEFKGLVLEAYEKNSSQLIAGRIAFSSGNSWDTRIEELLSIYNAHGLNGKTKT